MSWTHFLSYKPNFIQWLNLVMRADGVAERIIGGRISSHAGFSCI